LSTTTAREPLNVAPGSVVTIRDEEWLVSKVEQATDGQLLRVQGLSGLVRDTTAAFYTALDDIRVLDPAEATVTADASSGYRSARLWVEATLRKTSIPLTSPDISTSSRMLADSLPYQQTAVRQALDPDNLRPRILLADAVGLGKTLEIGMILSELAVRGRGERILIVTPRHVLEQFQHEMWTRFALPFVRLDSQGIQRLRQKLPAARNPFAVYKRAIISIDTLKNDRYVQHLRNQRWDAVVIDESHNLTNAGTQNNRLAHVLAPTTDALILASATPHNGRKESFAELVRMLEPSAVRPNGDFDEDEVRRLIIRRHRNSTEVAEAVGSDWAPRQEPNHRLVTASPEEDAVATELVDTWLHPTGSSPYSGRNGSLFPWTLAKAFLSSPEALLESTRQRMRRVPDSPEGDREKRALQRLEELASAVETNGSAKYRALVDHAKSAGVGRGSATRIVVFAERVQTLKALEASLPKALGLPKEAVAILHGGLTDEEQQKVVESFKLQSSPIRVLVTGDIASEGVNLHVQCHELVHFDIPWSLIRIEQRNGRIDRYGQKQAPRITTLLLSPDNERFAGDFRVLTRLLEREAEAHKALGDTASLMGKHSVQAEEDEIMRAIAAQQDIDEVVRTVDQVLEGDDFDAFWNSWEALAPTEEEPEDRGRGASAGLFPSDVSFLSEALEQAYTEPGKSLEGGGVGWRNHGNEGIVELTPPPDLVQRLAVLPQTYLDERKVTITLKLAVTQARGNDRLLAARSGSETNQWPDAHFLGPLHPVLDWASDRSLAKLGRGRIFAVRGKVDEPVIALLGTLTNGRGQVVAASHMTAIFGGLPASTACLIRPFGSAQELYESLGLTSTLNNPGPVDIHQLTPLVRPAVESARGMLDIVVEAARRDTSERVQRWASRVGSWESDASALIQRKDLHERRMTVEAERRLAEAMTPSRQLVRPLLVVVPADWPVAHSNEGAI
jgi:superfamily II DNA or RNA helicase